MKKNKELDKKLKKLLKNAYSKCGVNLIIDDE
jgi:hypothetical protein